MTGSALDQSRPAESATDAMLVDRVLDGEVEAFGTLVSRYQASLYRHAVALILDHDAAADMVQDALVRAFTRLRECRDRDRVRPWLFQILRHRCLDYLKDVRRRQVSLEDAGPLVDAADSPAVAVERAQLRSEIVQAFERLPHAQREAFVMHCIEGYSYEVMSELLDASVSALKMRVLRAREALAAALQERDVTSAPAVRLSVRQG